MSEHPHLRRAGRARRGQRDADLRARARRVRARRGHAALRRRAGRGTSTSSRGSRSRRSGHAHPAVADALAEQARTLLHVSNLYYNAVQPQVAEMLNAPARWRRPGVLLQLRGRGQRVRDQARPPPRPDQRWPRALPRDLGVRLVPRPHPHDARRHGPAPEAGDLPAPPARASARSRSPTSTRSRPRWTSGCAR